MQILEEKNNPLDVFCEASRILNEAVEHTLGPKGTNTAVQNKEGLYEIINDGKSIIEHLTSLDPAIAPALETLKQAAFETNRKAGDGTTSTTIIMNALLQGAREYLKETNNPVALRNILTTIEFEMLANLEKLKKDIKEEDYKKVATVALGSSKYAELLEDTYKFLGKNRRPALLKSDIDNIEVEKIDGVNLTKTKIVSNLFLETTEHTEIDTIFLFEPVNRFQEITQLLRKIQQTGKETLLFYNQLSSDILENLLFNYTNGAIKLIPICLNGYGKGTYTVMKDLAEYSGANVIDNTTCKVSEISKIQFGNIDYAIINAEQVILRKENSKLPETSTLDDKSVLIRVGGTNKVDREEIYKRLEDAVNSLGNAIDYGIVEGAGKTYIKMLEGINPPKFVYKAMCKIYDLIQIESDDVFDSVIVAKEVIKNSFTIVSQVITTHTLLHENIR